MGLILNIESSSTNCSISVSKNGKLIDFIEKNDPKYRQSNTIHQNILDLIKKNNLNCEFQMYGPGVEKVFQELKQTFPDKVIKILSSDFLKSQQNTLWLIYLREALLHFVQLHQWQ